MRSAREEGQRVYSKRRAFLMASAAGIGGILLFSNLALSPNRSGPLFAPPYAHAQGAPNALRPASFADVVEMVKPAVISVKVKMDTGRDVSGLEGGDNPLRGTPFEDFFRRFRSPDDSPRDRSDRDRGSRDRNNDREQSNQGAEHDRGYRGGDRDRGNADRDRGSSERDRDGDERGERDRGSRRHQYTTGQGSGFFISADGYAVTNNHVVDKAENKTVEITTDDGRTYSAKVIGTDERTDLALIKVDGRTDFPFVRLADKTPRIGDWVIAVGNPFGLGGTVTAGIVSARGRDIGSGPYDDFIQIDAAVNKGNSGGPTFDLDGNVIGVNTAIYSPSGGSVGIAFDIPADTVKTVIEQLKAHGIVTRGWIGVQIQQVTEKIADSLGLGKPRGALVAEPQAGSPAAKAGIKAGDVIVSVNGEPVPDSRNLVRRISSLAPGTTIKLGIFRNGKEETVTLTLGELSDRQARGPGGSGSGGSDDRAAPVDVPKLGLSLAPARNGGEGVVVTSVDPNGTAGDQFQTGDIILEVNGKPVNTPADVRKAVTDAQNDGKKSVLMRVKSSRGTHFVAVAINA